MLPPERAAKGEAKAKFAAGRFGNRTRETGKGKQSARRGRKNQCKTEGLRARKCDLDPISRTPYGPAANKGLHQEAGHTTVPDQTATDSVPNPRLPTSGRPHTS